MPPTELVRKVPLGFTSEGRIAWVIYFNYNQAGLSGSEKTTFKFLDNVGPNQTLAIDSIAAYLTKQPILETNGEMIRNLEHDEYSYDASQFFQKMPLNLDLIMKQRNLKEYQRPRAVIFPIKMPIIFI